MRRITRKKAGVRIASRAVSKGLKLQRSVVLKSPNALSGASLKTGGIGPAALCACVCIEGQENVSGDLSSTRG